MFDVVLERLRQKHRTVAYPKAPGTVSDRFRGRPVIGPGTCPDDCRACMEVCPTDSLHRTANVLGIDLGTCLFCGACERACRHGVLRFSRDYGLAGRRREDLVMTSELAPRVEALDKRMRTIFGRSLKLRQVSAGGCNACEADANVLTTVVFDIGRFGMEFVASPRHADGLYVTGPVPENMREALIKTYEA
ncbi:MAG: hydrogenase, partial [Deltaproteobacteria bacterium]|nr:hydrogenase [Deltaproteobacteria bacterium]